MQPFERAYLPPEASDVQWIMSRFKVSQERAAQIIAENQQEDIWMNDLYQVSIHDCGDILHLSIKRRDKEVIHDWRHLQEIKNLLVGPENEGVEIYPAESRLVDTANQYHLWVHKNPAFRFPVGWHEGRHVATSAEAAQAGAKQRER